jgi:uncharacterized membrane protein HdeD (DUF308 family)
MDDITTKTDNPIAEFAQGVKKNWGVILFMGILFIIGGVSAISYPLLWTGGVVLMLGWVILFSGIFRFVDAFATMKQVGFIWKIMGSLLYILAGIFILKFPLTGAVTLTLILGMFFIIEGISKTALAAEIKPLKGWVWTMFDGAITILFGILILSFLGNSALWLVGLLLGIKLLFAGWDLVYLGLALKNA